MAVVAWLRSPYYYYSYYFCDVNTNGSCNYNIAAWSGAVAPGFAMLGQME